MKGAGPRTALAGIALLAIGCDPVLNVFGSFFPAWVVCLGLGVVLAIAVRQGLARAGLEPYLGPPLLVYPALGVLLTLLAWQLLYRS